MKTLIIFIVCLGLVAPTAPAQTPAQDRLRLGLDSQRINADRQSVTATRQQAERLRAVLQQDRRLVGEDRTSLANRSPLLQEDLRQLTRAETAERIARRTVQHDRATHNPALTIDQATLRAQSRQVALALDRFNRHALRSGLDAGWYTGELAKLKTDRLLLLTNRVDYQSAGTDLRTDQRERRRDQAELQRDSRVARYVDN